MQDLLSEVPGVEAVFAQSPFFHEIVVKTNKPAHKLLQELAARGIQAGYALEQTYPEMENCLLLCATETKSKQDIILLANEMRDALKDDALNGEKRVCQA